MKASASAGSKTGCVRAKSAPLSIFLRSTLISRPKSRGVRSSAQPAKKEVAGNTAPANPPPVLLTVSDDADFLSHGGLIALVDIGNNIHLDINLTRARKLDLQFSANLLEIARRLE